MKQVIIFLTIIGVVLPSQGYVDLRSGSFQQSFLDFIVVNTNIDIRVQREYSSRRVQLGWFGWGWCSNFEKKLNIVDDRKLEYSSCHENIEFSYSQSNKIWTAKSYPQASLVFKSGRYELDFRDGFIYIFNDLGQLTQMIDKAGRKLKIGYSQTLLQSYKRITIADNSGTELVISFNQQNQVDEITVLSRRGVTLYRNRNVLRPKRWVFKYQYKDKNLVKVFSEKQLIYNYSYSAARNLIKAQREDGQAIEVSYFKGLDAVKDTRDFSGCREELKYWVDPKLPTKHHKTSYVKVCSQRIVKAGVYEFKYEDHHLNGQYLRSLSLTQNKKTKTIFFNPTTGRPIQRNVSNHK